MLNKNNMSEFIGQIIDIFEDFLEEKKCNILNKEKDGLVIIYGSNYDLLYEQLKNMIFEWDLIKENHICNINKGEKEC